jgi:hypothetical protein
LSQESLWHEGVAMNCVHAAGSTRARRRAITHIALRAAAAGLIMFQTGAAGIGWAQDMSSQSPSQTTSPDANRSVAPRGRLEAPIGHRQPTESDLPPSVRKEEGAATRDEKELDKKLNSICRGC